MPSAITDEATQNDEPPFALCHLLARQMLLQQSRPRGFRLLQAAWNLSSRQAHTAAEEKSQLAVLGAATLPSRFSNSGQAASNSSASMARNRFQDLQTRAFLGAQAFRSYRTS